MVICSNQLNQSQFAVSPRGHSDAQTTYAFQGTLTSLPDLFCVAESSLSPFYANSWREMGLSGRHAEHPSCSPWQLQHKLLIWKLM